MRKWSKPLLIVSLFLFVPEVYGLLTLPLQPYVDSGQINYMYILLGVYIIMTIILLPLTKQYLKEDAVIFQKLSKRKFIGIVFIYWLLLLAGNIVSAIEIAKIGIDSEAQNQVLIQEVFKESPVIMFGIAVFFAPIFEELVFRRAIYDLIPSIKKLFVRKDTSPSLIDTFLFLIISSLSFGLMHVISSGDYIFLIQYAMMGFVLAFIYVKTKNIYFSIGAHMFQNLLASIISIFFL